uniref:Alpha-carbonic anhydrase domain-containing protein n=1 Tax=Parascaris equorum TaxID=6256 RepID=A0A914S4L5_PAREQ
LAEGERGSEHTIDRVRFPAEVQLIAYNTDLYTNFSEAMTQPRGLLAVAVIVDIGTTTTTELRKLTVASQSITYKAYVTFAYRLQDRKQSLRNSTLMDYYRIQRTTSPMRDHLPFRLQIWNDLQQTESKQPNPVFMSPNYRPLKALNGRLIRTNINIKYKASNEVNVKCNIRFQSKSSQACASNVYVDMGYRSNPTRVSVTSLQKRHLEYDDDFDDLRPLPFDSIDAMDSIDAY